MSFSQAQKPPSPAAQGLYSNINSSTTQLQPPAFTPPTFVSAPSKDSIYRPQDHAMKKPPGSAFGSGTLPRLKSMLGQTTPPSTPPIVPAGDGPNETDKLQQEIRRLLDLLRQKDLKIVSLEKSLADMQYQLDAFKSSQSTEQPKKRGTSPSTAAENEKQQLKIIISNLEKQLNRERQNWKERENDREKQVIE
ncbi:MAG: hypothetical protein EZS28_028853 [Streblomastix strix]|uniref:Uncharacterized protein n=1 Tax=Streblomastix strix TaxID=222440 RepID=A0A5J4UZV8_9EUKA|nr:MAG: hypothetical protein EZS28_028853 [Streblomastix strix]